MNEQLILDNPLIVKHVRSRLRRKDLIAPVAVVVIISLFVTWFGRMEEGTGPLVTLIGLQGLILFLVGTSQVANAVAQARDSGILDFHRISPQTPITMAVGFLLGAPVREWVLAACVVPFELILLPSSKMSPHGLAVVMASLVTCTLLYHLLGLVVGLISPRPRVASSVTLLVLMLQMFSLAGPVGYFTMAPAWVLALKWSNLFHNSPFFPNAEKHYLMSLLHQLVLLAFLLVGAVREVRQERAYFTSKAGGLAFLALFCGLLSVDLQNFRDAGPASPWIYLYAVVVAGMVLVSMVTPDARDFAKGVRRAVRANLSRVPMWTDDASNWAALVGSVLIGGFAAVHEIRDLTLGPAQTQLLQATGIGLCALVAFGCARQGFELRYGRRHAKSYFTLLIFVSWVVPLLLAVVAGHAQSSNDVLGIIVGICPWIGMGVVATAPQVATTLVGLHISIAAYAMWWRWNCEQTARAAARLGR